MRISDWSSDVCSSDLRDVGQIFSLMSEFYSTAANRLDPHGRLLTPDMRAALEKNAHDSLLEMHSILKAWLSGDVDGTPTGSAPRRDRKATTRRKPDRERTRLNSTHTWACPMLFSGSKTNTH